MSAEATAINMAARASLWLKPHRIVLILIALALVLCAAFFMRWNWLPLYWEMGLLGIWRALWILVVTCALGFLLAVPLGLAQAGGPFWFAVPAKVFCTSRSSLLIGVTAITRCLPCWCALPPLDGDLAVHQARQEQVASLTGAG